jgi:hypothetical protein
LREKTHQPFLDLIHALEAVGGDEDRAYKLIVDRTREQMPKLINPQRK